MSDEARGSFRACHCVVTEMEKKKGKVNEEEGNEEMVQ